MPTNTAGTVARSFGGIPVTHYIAQKVDYDELGTATTAKVVGVIPAGSLILRCTVVITVGFNDTNGDDLDVGFTAGGAELGSAMDANSAAIDTGDIAAADTILALTEDKTVYVALTTGESGDGTEGTAYVIVEYMPVVQ